MNIIWVILSLAGVLGLFFILVYATKKLGTGVGFSNGSRMKVLDRVTVGRDGMLLVVSVAGKLVLIGVTGQHIEKLSDLDMTAEEYYNYHPQQTVSKQPGFSDTNGTMSFSDALARVLSRKKNSDTDNTQSAGSGASVRSGENGDD